MGHPDRKLQREKKKRTKQEMLGRKSVFDVQDLTPQNAVGCMSNRKYEIRLK